MFEGTDLLGLPQSEIETLRGSKIAMIFQDPSSSLNPVFTIGSQIERVIRQHMPVSKSQAGEKTRARCWRRSACRTWNASWARIRTSFPAGMQQRVMIAMALSCNPRLLIADEPTTALDVTIQAQILKLLRDLQKTFDISVILITHNLGVIAQTCDRLAVLYAGRVAEIGSTRDIFNNPQHPYTRGLMTAIPRPGAAARRWPPSPAPSLPTPARMTGCPFAPRCEFVFDRCTGRNPAAVSSWARTTASACFLAECRKMTTDDCPWSRSVR